MYKSVIEIKKMDCPSEISQIKALFENNASIKQLEFDLGVRRVTFYHENNSDSILSTLKKVGLEGTLVESTLVETFEAKEESSSHESKTLLILLLLNFSMFLFEIVFGYFSESTGLIADSIDMLADSLVYGVSLYAVGRASQIKNRAAFLSGIFQMTLAFGCILEVIRRFIYGSEPLSTYMISVSVLALIVNISCLALIHKHKDGGVHMKASWIFSANDVIANIGVIIAGVLVAVTGSRYPDLVIGALIALIVLSGAIRILKITKETSRASLA